MSKSMQEKLNSYVQKFDYNEASIPQFSRMVNLKSINDRVSNLFHQISKDHKNSTMPDITFSSYFESSSEILNEVSKLPLYIHIISAIMCLLWSTIFHLFYVHSPVVSKVLCKLDYAGISFLIGGSSVSPVYYMLYWDDGEILRPLYLIIIALGCFSVFTVSMSSYFDVPEYRKFKAIIFVLLGCAVSFPIIQFWFFRNEITMPIYPTSHWTLGGAVYILGAFVYSSRIPECFFPGKFDFFGHSHNLWHFFVLTAAVIHYYGSLELYHLRRHYQCPAY